MKNKFIVIPTINGFNHIVRPETIYRIAGNNERETSVKSQVHLENGTTLNCTITENKVLELIRES